MTLLETLRALAQVVTPGEWAVNPFIAQIDCPALDEYGDPLPVLRMLWPTTYRGEAETQANAQLIVTFRNALPELIAALEVVERVLDEDWLAERIAGGGDVVWSKALDAARAITAALPKEEV